jgi:hypothetical protein
MKRDLEIFRGAGAMAALEAATIRALLEGAGIPVGGVRMSIVVAAKHYQRARQLVAAAFPVAVEAKEEHAARMRRVGA